MAQNCFENALFSSICKGIRHVYNDGLLCDLTVEVGTSKFSCHRVILASVSEYFHNVLCNGSDTCHISIQNEQVTAEIFAVILDILYKGKDHVQDTETAVNILKAAMYLRIRYVRERCENFLGSNFDKFTQTSSFLSLPRESLFAIISSANLVVSNEDNVCKALFKWLEYDADRSSFLPEFLPLVRFYMMTDAYLWELQRLSFSYNAALFDYVAEALIVKLETVTKTNSSTKSEIMSRQGKTTPLDNMETVSILIGGTTESGKRLVKLFKFPLDENVTYKDNSLTSLPVDCGTGFASCVWRNELYVSGGSEKPQFFTVYNSGLNECTVLPDLPRGRENHAMAAANSNIYILGGLEELTSNQKEPSTSVMTYNLRSKSWSVTANLFKAVQEVSAFALGHKIYIFGGRDVDENAVALVQCLNTLTGCVYVAGFLPFSTTNVCPLVDLETIYLVCCEGKVLRMDDALDEDKRIVTSMSTEKDLEERSQFAVRFVQVADVTKRRNFGAFLHNGKIVMCGGESENGALLKDVEEVEISTKEVKQRTNTLPKPICHFGLHVIYLPKSTESVSFKFTFLLDSLLTAGDDGINSHTVIFDNLHWYLRCFKSRANGKLTLSCQLMTKESGRVRWKTNMEYSFLLLPKIPTAKTYNKEFTKPDPYRSYMVYDASGWDDAISLEELKNPENGYIENGEVTIRTTIKSTPNITH